MIIFAFCKDQSSCFLENGLERTKMDTEGEQMLATNNSSRRGWICKHWEHTYSVVRWKLQEIKGKTIIRFYKNYKDYHLSRSFLSACVTWWEANLWVRKQGKISDSSQLLTVSLLRRKEIKFRVCVGICIRLGMEERLF